jgi:hypothetical protein
MSKKKLLPKTIRQHRVKIKKKYDKQIRHLNQEIKDLESYCRFDLKALSDRCPHEDIRNDPISGLWCVDCMATLNPCSETT